MICPSCHTDNIAGEDICRNCGMDLRDLDTSDSLGHRAPEFISTRLAELPGKAPATLNATDPVGLAVRLMQSEDTSCVLVMAKAELAGIITSWDVLHKVAGPNEDLNAVTCGQIMTADPVVLREDDTIAVAINKMSHGGFRHIPLVEKGVPTRIFSTAEVFRYLAPFLA